MAFSIFISYSTKNLERAQLIQTRLSSYGTDVFLAENSIAPGQDISPAITARILTCDLFLLLLSLDSSQSKWVPIEIGMALGANRKILPIALQSDPELPAFLHDRKYLKFHPDSEAAMRWLWCHVCELYRAKLDKTFFTCLGALALGFAVYQAGQCEC